MAPSTAPSPEEFRRLMGRWATGVSVVTAHEGRDDAGLTVNGFLSVSLAPPSVLVSLARDVDTLPVIARSGRFGVSLLAADQRALSERFARNEPSDAKFRELAFHRGPGGTPLLDGTLGGLECQVAARWAVSDHVLLVGEVDHQETGRDGLPLLFYRSAYAEVDAPDRLRLPAGRR